MAVQTAFPGMRRISNYVASLSFAADVDLNGQTFCDIDTAPIAANATGLLSAQSIAAAGNTGTFVAAYANNVASIANQKSTMGKYGRNITVVASGAATSTVTITGYDYLGQKMQETLTLNGTTPVLGAKCFFEVINIAWGATSSTTINVGFGDRLGIPYRALSTQLLGELVSDATPTAGALVAGGANPQIVTSVDPRGYYTPQASFVANGTRTYRFNYFADRTNLHGPAHFTT